MFLLHSFSAESTSLFVNNVLSIVIKEASTIGPRQKVYLKEEMYLTEKNISEARQIESASSTCDDDRTFSTFCLRLCSSFLRKISHILPNAIRSSIGAKPTTKMWMSLFVLMQNSTIASATVKTTRLALTFLHYYGLPQEVHRLLLYFFGARVDQSSTWVWDCWCSGGFISVRVVGL